MDAVRYHPLYNGFRPLCDGTSDDPVDLTTLEDQIFYPPEGEEWIAFETTPQTESTTEPRRSYVVEDPFNPRNMLPYVSPNTLAQEEERESEQEYHNWGEYMSSSTNSLDKFNKVYKINKSARH